MTRGLGGKKKGEKVSRVFRRSEMCGSRYAHGLSIFALIKYFPRVRPSLYHRTIRCKTSRNIAADLAGIFLFELSR